MQVFQIFPFRSLDKVSIHLFIGVQREWIVVNWKLLKVRAIRVPVQLKAIDLTAVLFPHLNLFLEVVCVLILSDEYVIRETSAAGVEELI